MVLPLCHLIILTSNFCRMSCTLFVLCLAWVETIVDLKDRRTKVLEGRLQENKDVRGFHDNSWQQSVV